MLNTIGYGTEGTRLTSVSLKNLYPFIGPATILQRKNTINSKNPLICLVAGLIILGT